MLSLVCKKGGVSSLQRLVGMIRNIHLHQAWQQAITCADLLVSKAASQRDVQLLSKLKNLQKIIIRTPVESPNRSSITPSQLITQVAPALSNLSSIHASGPSSFEVLQALQASEQLWQQITHLALRDDKYQMTADDMYTLADMQALAALELQCLKLRPQQTSRPWPQPARASTRA